MSDSSRFSLKYIDKFDMHVHLGYANVGKKNHFLAKCICLELWLGGGVACRRITRTTASPRLGLGIPIMA